MFSSNKNAKRRRVSPFDRYPYKAHGRIHYIKFPLKMNNVLRDKLRNDPDILHDQSRYAKDQEYLVVDVLPKGFRITPVPIICSNEIDAKFICKVNNDWLPYNQSDIDAFIEESMSDILYQYKHQV